MLSELGVASLAGVVVAVLLLSFVVGSEGRGVSSVVLSTTKTSLSSFSSLSLGFHPLSIPIRLVTIIQI